MESRGVTGEEFFDQLLWRTVLQINNYKDAIILKHSYEK